MDCGTSTSDGFIITAATATAASITTAETAATKYYC